jgi:phenylacetate-CoA ligase
MYPELSEAERFPLLTSEGRRFLHALRQDAQAPKWNWPNGEQLDAEGLARVEQFAAELERPRSWTESALPTWLDAFVTYCLTEIPFYRGRSKPGARFADVPSCSRDDLAPRVWEFVPDDQPLGPLIVFSSSGTTGHPAQMPTHPATAACGVPLLEYAVREAGVSFPRGPGQMALTNIAAYRGAYTTAIVVAYLQEAGCIRVNLHEEAWHQPEHCRAYLDRWATPVMLGDPQAFAALENVAIRNPPSAMLSSIMHLSDAFAEQLTARYCCPIIDLYALTEAGIVARRTPVGHEILPPDLYVEILNDEDEPCPPGVRGEIALTGGRNPYCPLLRYRTGDYASLTWIGGRPVLVDFEGRRPVWFYSAKQEPVHSMEVSRRLRSLSLAQFALRQDEAGNLHFGRRGFVDDDEVRTALAELFGPAGVTIYDLPAPSANGRKVRVYESSYAPTRVAQ